MPFNKTSAFISIRAVSFLDCKNVDRLQHVSHIHGRDLQRKLDEIFSAAGYDGKYSSLGGSHSPLDGYSYYDRRRSERDIDFETWPEKRSAVLTVKDASDDVVASDKMFCAARDALAEFLSATRTQGVGPILPPIREVVSQKP